MPKKGHSEEQIVAALRQGEAGEKVSDVCRIEYLECLEGPIYGPRRALMPKISSHRRLSFRGRVKTGILQITTGREKPSRSLRSNVNGPESKPKYFLRFGRRNR